MESIAELKRICRRENYEDNKKTMLLAARVSIYFTKLFLSMNLSANQVTYIFISLGILSAAAFLGHGLKWLIAGYMLHRLHVICDVSDGEVARYRKTFSAQGAYLDYLAHYLIYALILFSIATRLYIDTGQVSALFTGFILVLANTMNRAACDCWFRANFGKSSRSDIEEGTGSEKRVKVPAWKKFAVLTFAHLSSVQTFLNLYLLTALTLVFLHIDLRLELFKFYALILTAFSSGRIYLTIKRGKIPRRASYY